MESAPSRRCRIVAIAVAAALVTAGAFVAWELLRARSLAEVFTMGQWQAGSQVTVEGTITGVKTYATSYGPIVSVGLDGVGPCTGSGNTFGAVLGDPNATYTAGERFRTTLHFADYRFNDVASVSAPELVCPLPLMLVAVSRVLDTISGMNGILLAYNGTDGDGWTRYEMVTPQADTFRPDVLPVTLRRALPLTSGTINSAARWITMAAVEYVSVSGQYTMNPIVDDMVSLAQATSRNGTLRYVDVDGDGLAGDGDRLDVRLPSPGTGQEYATYMLQIGEVGGRMAAYAYGGHYILDGPRGPFEPLPSDQNPVVELRYAGDHPGNPVTSEASVLRTRFGPPLPLSGLGFHLGVNNSWATGDFTHFPVTILGGVSFDYRDQNANALLDAGDRIVVANLPNRTRVSFQVTREGATWSDLTWTTGFGRSVGRPPSFVLSPSGTGPTRVAVAVDYWHPDLALAGTLRVSLSQDGIPVLANGSLAGGSPVGFSGGSLTFQDRDADGYLSTGDEFLVQGTAGARYELTVFFFGQLYRSTTFLG